MGYRIAYPPAGRFRRINHRKSRRAAFAGAFALLLFVCVMCFWPEGTDAVYSLLFSGDRDATAEALETFALQLAEGTPVREAFVSFGRSILKGSGYGIY